jgi:hypothetical protein
MIALIFICLSVVAKLASQTCLIHQLDLEKRIWEFAETHVEFTDDRHNFVCDRNGVAALDNTRVSSRGATDKPD